MERSGVGGWRFDGPGSVRISFDVPVTEAGTLLGWGLWFYISPNVDVRIEGFSHKATLEAFAAPDWGKAGSIWRSDGEGLQFSIVFEGSSAGWEMAVYDTSAGAIGHEFFDAVSADPDTTRATRLMSNMWFFAPEANFVTPALHVEITEPVLIGSNALVDGLAEIVLKSCNRCARFLPINVHNERQQLSFSTTSSPGGRAATRPSGGFETRPATRSFSWSTASNWNVGSARSSRSTRRTIRNAQPRR